MIYAPIVDKEGLTFKTGLFEASRENLDEINRIDKEQEKKGKLLHRFIFEPIADGNAIYQIIKVNANTVRVRHCKGHGDDYYIPYWGEEMNIEKTYALKSVRGRDILARMFS